MALSDTSMTGLAARHFVRAQDLVWIVLFAALALLGPDSSPEVITVLICLGMVQILEPKIPSFASPRGNASSFGIKLVLCYLLIGWTHGIASNYFWIFLFPVITAATTMGGWGALTAITIASAAYLSFLLFLKPTEYIPMNELRVLALRVIGLPVVGYLTHQLAEATRAEARNSQQVADELAEANRNLKAAEAAALRSQRLAALGQLSAGLAHELRNPLGTMKTSAEFLAKSVEPSNDVARELAGFISSEVDRTNSLVTRFLDFARPLALRSQKADIGTAIDQAVEELGRHQPPFEVTIYKNYSPEIRPFPFDPELMGRVLYNLLLNAAEASSARGSITVKTREVEGYCEVAVIDRGSGISKEDLENIFNPFFTTKATGTGLGLAIISKIVDEHCGKIAVESEPGQGSVFRIYLPMERTA